MSQLLRCLAIPSAKFGDRKDSFSKPLKSIQPHRPYNSNCGIPNWLGEFTTGKDKRLQLGRKLTTQLPLIKRQSALSKRHAPVLPRSDFKPGTLKIVTKYMSPWWSCS